MAHSYTYQSFCDYTVLPELREACANGATEFELTTLPPLHLDAIVEQANRAPDHVHKEIYKSAMQGTNPPLPTAIIAFVTNCHMIATDIFKNLSHVMELPWEKYLGELHEYAAKGRDVLRLIDLDTDEPKMQWSTLTMVFDEKSQNSCRVIFGEAMAVFSEGSVKATSRKLVTLDEGEADGSATDGPKSKLFVYDVRPNESVYYTRGAGALMTPLTQQEFDTRKRVGEVGVGA